MLRKVTQRDLIERIGSRAEMPARQVQIDGCVLQVPMPQQQLNGAKIRACLQQVRREAVAQGMRPDSFRETGTEGRFMARVPHGLVRDRLLWFRGFFASWEQVNPEA